MVVHELDRNALSSALRGCWPADSDVAPAYCQVLDTDNHKMLLKVEGLGIMEVPVPFVVKVLKAQFLFPIRQINI